MKTFVLTLCVVLAGSVSSALSAQQPAPDGKLLYEQNCRSCHGPRGVPPQAMVRMMKVPVLDSAYFVKHTVDSVLVVLKQGRGKNMKSFSDKLNAEQMLAVARYVQQLVTKE
jgi:mono/diheme cytochrome c family protein